MDSVGDTLRRERLRQNLDLQQVARETKIGVRLLEAIETDNFDRLPGGVFAKSFVRQYARVLGLDEEELAARVERMIQPAPEEAGTVEAPPREIAVPRVSEWDGAHRPHSTSWLPALAMVVVVMLVCSAVYAWWQKSKQPQAQEVASAPITAAPQPQPEPQSTPAEQAPAAEPPASQPTPTEPAPAPAETPATGPTPAAQEPPPSAEAGIPGGDVHLVFKAEEDTWVSARSDGKLIYSGVLKSNETKAVTGAGEMRVVLGNAGGVNITLNGKPVPALGPKGQVRVVQFSPGGVQIVPRNPPSPAPDPL